MHGCVCYCMYYSNGEKPLFSKKCSSLFTLRGRDTEPHLSAVGTLVYILVQLLDSLDGGDDLDVDVAVVLSAEVRVVRNDLDAWIA